MTWLVVGGQGLGGSGGAGVVAFAGVDAEFVTGFLGGDVDGAVAAVAVEEGGLVGNQVTAADDFLKIVEALVEPAYGAGDKGGAAGVFGEDFEGAIAGRSVIGSHGRVVGGVVGFAGTDGVDEDFAMGGGGDGLFQSGGAGIVFAVADDDEDAGDGLIFGAGGGFVGGEK